MTLGEVQEARARIQAYVRVTPVIRWVRQNGRDPRHSLAFGAGKLAAPVTLKLEHLQVGGSFKARGACNRILSAAPSELRGPVVTASGGNHGLGVAYAANCRSLPSVIFLPESAPRRTEQRLAAMGAGVVRGGRNWDDAWALAVAHARATGGLLVHPFEDAAVIAGQGTIGLELLEQVPDVELVIVAIGGGGLIGGVAAALHAARPSVRVIGVEPTGAASMKEALAAGRVVELAEVRTIAGTLAPRAVGPNSLALAQEHVEEIVLVSDDELRAAMRLLWDELRILVEPAGAAAAAAWVSGRVPVGDARSIAVLVCGANLDGAMAAEAVG